MKTTSIPKWRPGSIKVGQRYKYDYNGKTYIFQAKFNTTLTSFNSIWFESVYPKKYYFVNKTAFDNSNVVLLPNDIVYVEGYEYKNTSHGVLTKAMLDVIFAEYIEKKQNSYLLVNGEEDHRKQLVKIRPFLNTKEPELKYFLMNDQTGYAYVKTYRVLREVVIDFQVVETFTPVRAVSKNFHSVVVDHTGYSVMTVGDAPISSSATTKTYSVPNTLTTKRLIVTPKNDELILNFQ